VTPKPFQQPKKKRNGRQIVLNITIEQLVIQVPTVTLKVDELTITAENVTPPARPNRTIRINGPEGEYVARIES